ncbi:DUF1960-domain-containing protein [Crucibulum laeve]|uniref:DUF1960-domain-containing protein n=1 Tax=Crucibulum laeve TaxID=68775 RepID=A0A5C3MR71_9AGAR|nr:DUF1960-domain-containing protein [Crucibulum laeve]
MAKSITKVIYKPDSQSTDEYTVIVADIEQYKKWKEGDTTIPLADVVDSFSVFHSGQGAQGILGKASNQQLDTVFDTHNDVEVVTYILKNGTLQAGEGINNSNFGTLNVGRGSIGVDTRGSGNTSGIGGR